MTFAWQVEVQGEGPTPQVVPEEPDEAGRGQTSQDTGQTSQGTGQTSQDTGQTSQGTVPAEPTQALVVEEES